MPLTPENRRFHETEEGLGWKSISHDISVMDEEQLAAFVRRAFLAKPNYDTLPARAWSLIGENHTQTQVQAVGNHLSGLYRGLTGRDTLITERPAEEDVDPLYQERLDTVLIGIADECLIHEGEPTPELLTLAQGLVHTVDLVRWYEGPDSLSDQVRTARVVRAEELGTNSLKIFEAIAISQRIPRPQIGENPLYQATAALLADTRYQSVETISF